MVVSKHEDVIKAVYRILCTNIFSWYMRVASPLLGTSGISLTKETVELFPACKNIEEYGFDTEELRLIASQ